MEEEIQIVLVRMWKDASCFWWLWKCKFLKWNMFYLLDRKTFIKSLPRAARVWEDKLVGFSWKLIWQYLANVLSMHTFGFTFVFIDKCVCKDIQCCITYSSDTGNKSLSVREMGNNDTSVVCCPM